MLYEVVSIQKWSYLINVGSYQSHSLGVQDLIYVCTHTHICSLGQRGFSVGLHGLFRLLCPLQPDFY